MNDSILIKTELNQFEIIIKEYLKKRNKTMCNTFEKINENIKMLKLVKNKKIKKEIIKEMLNNLNFRYIEMVQTMMEENLDDNIIKKLMIGYLNINMKCYNEDENEKFQAYVLCKYLKLLNITDIYKLKNILNKKKTWLTGRIKLINHKYENNIYSINENIKIVDRIYDLKNILVNNADEINEDVRIILLLGYSSPDEIITLYNDKCIPEKILKILNIDKYKLNKLCYEKINEKYIGHNLFDDKLAIVDKKSRYESLKNYMSIYNQKKIKINEIEMMLYEGIKKKLDIFVLNIIDTYKKTTKKIYDDGNTLLILACKNLSDDTCVKIIDIYGEKCMPEHINRKYKTALLIACERNLEKTAKKLIEKFKSRSMPFYADSENKQSIYYAVHNKMTEVVNKLIIESKLYNKK